MLKRFEVGGRATVEVSAPPEVQRAVAARMDPLEPVNGDDEDPDVLVRPAEPGDLGGAIELQRAAGDGVVTASDGERLQLIAADSRCSLPDPVADHPATFAYEPGFPIAGTFWRTVRTAVQLSLLRHDAVAVHASCTEVDGHGVLFAGWSETGKTECALALAEAGGRFLSDKWTVLRADGEVAVFPIEVGVRSWALPYLPRLRSSLPAAARVQLGVAGRAATPAGRLRERATGTRSAPLAQALERGVMLAERAPVAPSAIRAAYGQDDDPARAIPLRAVVLLTTVPEDGGTPTEAGSEWMAQRLALSASYERRPYFGLAERARFALPDRSRQDLPDDVVDAERQLLGNLLEGRTLLECRVPFPMDPAAVVDAVAERL